MIEPIVLGGGKRIFPDDGAARPFELCRRTTAAHGRPGLPVPARPLTTSARASASRRPTCDDRRVAIDLTPEDQQALAWAVSTASPTGQAITARAAGR